MDSTGEEMVLVSPRRMAWVAAVFFFCALGIAVRLFGITVLHRSSFLRDMRQASRRLYFVPAVRGRLLDRDGRPLAWSIRRFDLWWHPPRAGEVREREARDFAAAFPQAFQRMGRRLPASGRRARALLLVRGLSPGQLERARKFCAGHPEFEVRTTFERHTIRGAPALRRRLGRTRIEDGREIGVSGEEKLHDALLEGHPGVYSVLVDKHGRWVPDTWRKLQDMQPGYDVYLPLRAGDFQR